MRPFLGARGEGGHVNQNEQNGNEGAGSEQNVANEGNLGNSTNDVVEEEQNTIVSDTDLGKQIAPLDMTCA